MQMNLIWRRLLSPAHPGINLTLHSLMAVCSGVAILFASYVSSNIGVPASSHTAEVMSDAEVDAALESAASVALGTREGTIIVMDPQNGRLRAVVNPHLAFERAFPPGSAIKPFTLLAALRSSLIGENSRVLCREHYARNGFAITCPHPREHLSFTPAEALAHSCNFFFATIGERLNKGAFNATLNAYGFGVRTDVNTDSESAGEVPGGEWRVSTALGLNEHLLVTPIQLISAYAALVNGGHLYAPQRAAAQDFIPQERESFYLSPAHRALLLEGMRGAVKYGTAERAALDSLPRYIFGKTGTSTATENLRNQGWFIGFATDQSTGAETSPSSIKLAVLVFLKGAHGSQCAEVARPVFDEFLKTHSEADAPRQSESSSLIPASPGSSASGSRIRVHLVRENSTRTMSVEEYVLGVVAAEGSTEDELAALKALAVASRTFALKNRARHARAGYDFCSTTHCQRYLPVNSESNRARELVRRAVAETSGEILRDEAGQVAEAYFHASCGGMTANIGTLWGQPAPAYARGVRDDFCALRPNRSWTDVIPAAQLAQALRSDPRTDVGARLDEIKITRRDATGRAEFISLAGAQHRQVRGWDFKIIVGRALGWNVLKSSRFEVTRAGTNFVFRGSGFGHGLGLCQEGAHVMAERGASYQRILAYYLPGTSIKTGAATERYDDATMWRDVEAETWPEGEAKTPPLANGGEATGLLHPISYHISTLPRPSLPLSPRPRIPASLTDRRMSLSSAHFRASYPPGVVQREVEIVLHTLEAARADMMRRLAAASLNPGGLEELDVIIHHSTGDFVAATGQPPWAAAATRGQQIALQPLPILRRRGVLTSTLRHEYAHAVIDTLGHGRAPRWLAEGLAVYVAGEGPMLSRHATGTRLTQAELDQRLARPSSALEMRALYAAAYREVLALIRAEGEASVWRRVARS